ncbi:MAG: chemotaxis protein CheW [Deltaproteobacteria bacterium]|nr:chemotaxis protein CheW [Deltaproteobacteria bacterium]
MSLPHDDEIFLAFVEEGKEHAETLEHLILSLERGREDGVDAVDQETIGSMFRAAHSIKGTAGFFSVEPITVLAHAMENVLGLLRSEDLECGPEVTSALLAGTDLLRRMLEDTVHLETVDTRAVLETLGAIAERSEAQAEARPEVRTEAPTEARAEAWTEAQAEPEPEEAELGGYADLDAEADGDADAEAHAHADRDAEAHASLADTPSLDEPGAGSSASPGLASGTGTRAPGESKTPAPSANGKARTRDAEGASTIRVNVAQLNRLMMLAGELVLTRNALLKQSALRDLEQMVNLTQRVDAITSELQDGVMATRMQPIGVVFSRFRRTVRDLSRTLKKKINLTISGEDVELDKTLVETIGDPLTHLVRNAADHGIEPPEVRVAKGKSETATIGLRAYHEAGQVVIEVSDDGAGMDAERIGAAAVAKGLISRERLAEMGSDERLRLIFLAGFSTAERVTDVSGRGVGMDVVLRDLTRVAGTVDIRSALGVGTTITVRLPLTLAIMPSILVSVNDERFAIPQSNVLELVRIPPGEVKRRLERLGRAEILRLRGELLPLVRLSHLLGMKDTYIDEQTQERREDRRVRLTDRRAETDASVPRNSSSSISLTRDIDERRREQDRRRAPASAVNVVVLSTSTVRFGLVVDQLLDSEEIVVKPLGFHMARCREYAGATILGDGAVALILSVAGLANSASLGSVQSMIAESERVMSRKPSSDSQTYLIVENAPGEYFGIPFGLVGRIQRIQRSSITTAGGRRTLTSDGKILPLIAIEEIAETTPSPDARVASVVICNIYGRDVGLLVGQVHDIVDGSDDIDDVSHAQPGIFGSTLIQERVVLLADVYGMVDRLIPDLNAMSARRDRRIQLGDHRGDVARPPEIPGSDPFFGVPGHGRDGGREAAARRDGARLELDGARTATVEPPKRLVLVVEDSPFFRKQLVQCLQEGGFDSIRAEDGQAGLRLLEENADRVGLVITDIEMPVMDGLEMTRRVRAQDRFRGLPMIAVTSLSGEVAERRGLEVGLNEYLIKLDRDQILDRASHYLNKDPVQNSGFGPQKRTDDARLSS